MNKLTKTILALTFAGVAYGGITHSVINSSDVKKAKQEISPLWEEFQQTVSTGNPDYVRKETLDGRIYSFDYHGKLNEIVARRDSILEHYKVKHTGGWRAELGKGWGEETSKNNLKLYDLTPWN